MAKKLWLPHEEKYLHEHFPNEYTQDVADFLQRPYQSVCNHAFILGIKKSQSFRNMELQKQAKRLKIAGKAYQYKLGSSPINKGQKMPVKIYEKVKATMFKKGSTPHNAKKHFEEVLRNDKCGKQYYMIKLPTEKRLVYKHIWLWKEKHGFIKKGFNIVFKDNNSLNCSIENLECISNAELMQRNTIHRYPTELKHVIKLSKKLNKKINEHRKNS